MVGVMPRLGRRLTALLAGAALLTPGAQPGPASERRATFQALPDEGHQSGRQFEATAASERFASRPRRGQFCQELGLGGGAETGANRHVAFMPLYRQATQTNEMRHQSDQYRT